MAMAKLRAPEIELAPQTCGQSSQTLPAGPYQIQWPWKFCSLCAHQLALGRGLVKVAMDSQKLALYCCLCQDHGTHKTKNCPTLICALCQMPGHAKLHCNLGKVSVGIQTDLMIKEQDSPFSPGDIEMEITKIWQLDEDYYYEAKYNLEKVGMYNISKKENDDTAGNGGRKEDSENREQELNIVTDPPENLEPEMAKINLLEKVGAPKKDEGDAKNVGPTAEIEVPIAETAGPIAETAGPTAETAGPIAETAGPKAEVGQVEKQSLQLKLGNLQNMQNPEKPDVVRDTLGKDFGEGQVGKPESKNNKSAHLAEEQKSPETAKCPVTGKEKDNNSILKVANPAKGLKRPLCVQDAMQPSDDVNIHCKKYFRIECNRNEKLELASRILKENYDFLHFTSRMQLNTTQRGSNFRAGEEVKISWSRDVSKPRGIKLLRTNERIENSQGEFFIHVSLNRHSWNTTSNQLAKLFVCEKLS